MGTEWGSNEPFEDPDGKLPSAFYPWLLVALTLVAVALALELP